MKDIKRSKKKQNGSQSPQANTWKCIKVNVCRPESITDLQFLPMISSLVYSVSSRKLSEAKICHVPQIFNFTNILHTNKHIVIWHSGIMLLTMGLSGSLGSVMTKFFSIRSSVVARSMPLRISRKRSLSSNSSKLSCLSSSIVIRISGSINSTGSGWLGLGPNLSNLYRMCKI